ncbi:DinB family protein [Patiriisocius marinus]|uniref:DinB family protein n=1 Tax=Patiriisocius marinus TaxID=1397112 RepID=UPI00232FF8D2|nr:DinB family protein [Patiriisocius marinus]
MKYTIDITLKNRDLFLQFLEKTPLKLLNKIPEGFNNNIFWNIKHTVITQQLLVYGLSGLPMNVSEEEITKFRKGSAPQGDVTQEEIDLCKSQLHTLINKTEEDWEKGLFINYKEYTVTTKTTLTSAQDALIFNNFHEGIHLGYILALKRALGI